MRLHNLPLLAILAVSVAGVLGSCYRKDPLYCDGQTACLDGLVCDLVAHECRPGPGGGDLSGIADLLGPPPADMRTGSGSCFRNFECPGSACDPAGSCHDKGRIIVVDDGLKTCPPAGSTGGPYCTVQDALGDKNLGTSKDLILVLPSASGKGHSHNGDFIDIKGSVRIVGARTGARDMPPLLRDPVRILGSSLTTDVQVDIEDLTLSPISSGNVSAIQCVRSSGQNAVRLGVRWSWLLAAPQWGLDVEGCTPVVAISNQVRDNGTTTTPLVSGGGMLLGATVFMAFNNIVANNNAVGVLGLAAVTLGNQIDGSVFAFNTLVNNHCGGLGCNLICPQSFPVSYTIAVGDLSVGSGCALSMSVKSMPDFVDPGNEDYHLQMTAKNLSMLRVPDSNPVVRYDIDGDPRPVAGGLVDIGADQLP